LKIAVVAAPQFGELTYQPYPGYKKKSSPNLRGDYYIHCQACNNCHPLIFGYCLQSKIENRKSKIEMSWEDQVNWVEPDKRAIDLEQVSQK